ncbi:hypothetical protein HYV79_01950 [Candidatus Woesearchaeota archaeon]|nr:hypothetical protein [Candidatus Woesearchaeota archaeon]
MQKRHSIIILSIVVIIAIFALVIALKPVRTGYAEITIEPEAYTEKGTPVEFYGKNCQDTDKGFTPETPGCVSITVGTAGYGTLGYPVTKKYCDECRADVLFEYGCYPNPELLRATAGPGGVSEKARFRETTGYTYEVHAKSFPPQCVCQQGLTGAFCTYPKCGNNKKEVGEACDGTDVRGKTCNNFNYAFGTLSCKPDCSDYDWNRCTNCGNKVCDLYESFLNCPFDCPITAYPYSCLKLPLLEFACKKAQELT